MFVECTGHGRSIASDNMSSHNSDHSGERLSQNGDNESLYLHNLKNGVLLPSICVCTVGVKINNDELAQTWCVARVTCLVVIMSMTNYHVNQ